jgi:hypothetical protein
VGQPHPRPLSGTERGELAGSTAWSYDFQTTSSLDPSFPASSLRLPSPSRRGVGGIGVKRPQVDHPLPPGEGRGEGTALYVESCCGRGHSTLVTSASGSVEASPSPRSPSPGGRGVTRFEDSCPRITNGHLDSRLTRLTPMGAGGEVCYPSVGFRLQPASCKVSWNMLYPYRLFRHALRACSRSQDRAGRSAAGPDARSSERRILDVFKRAATPQTAPRRPHGDVEDFLNTL